MAGRKGTNPTTLGYFYILHKLDKLKKEKSVKMYSIISSNHQSAYYIHLEISFLGLFSNQKIKT